VSGSTGYSIRVGSLEQQIHKLTRSHYKKDKVGAEEFLQLLKDVIGKLLADPQCHGSYPEPRPDGTSQCGGHLRKLHFNMPNIKKGAAKCGRLIYLVEAETQTIRLLWLYTHAEFEKRPADKDLGKLLHAAQQARQAELASRKG
jgi:hypothetical protein